MLKAAVTIRLVASREHRETHVSITIAGIRHVIDIIIRDYAFLFHFDDAIGMPRDTMAQL